MSPGNTIDTEIPSLASSLLAVRDMVFNAYFVAEYLPMYGMDIFDTAELILIMASSS